MDSNPLSVILVKSDSKGDRLLFRYPFITEVRSEQAGLNKRKNPYALIVTEDLLQSPPPQTSNINIKGQLTGFADDVLSTLFAVKQELCEKKFELKVNDVRFVGHPTLLNSSRHMTNNKESQGMILLHIVFALHATASHSIVKCYYDLSKRLGVALRHEERRCGYVSKEIKLMVTAHDEVAARPEDGTSEGVDSPFDLILRRSSLARNLKVVYNELIGSGLIHVRINKWIEISFCLPQKVHQFHKKDFIITPETIQKCLQALRPYHGLLLLVDANELLNFFPPDASPALVRLVRIYTPLKSIQTLAMDADLTLSQVFHLAGHLLYLAKATVIYPLCESNVYVIAPDAQIDIHSPLVERFTEQFPGMSLLQILSEFSLPTSIGQKFNPLNYLEHQQQLVQMIVWMLQHHLLLQLHTYIYFVPTNNGPSFSQKSNFRSNMRLQANQGAISTILTTTPKEEIIGSYQSNSEDANIVPNTAASESDLSSILSDEGTSKALVNNVLQYGSLTSTDTEVGVFVNSIEEEKTSPKNDSRFSLLPEDFLVDFTDEERAAIFRTPAAANSEDLGLLVRLCRLGYLQGSHHLEEIMYLENLRRSQLLQLLDKFRDILITCETEDPSIAVFYSHS